MRASGYVNTHARYEVGLSKACVWWKKHKKIYVSGWSLHRLGYEVELAGLASQPTEAAGV